MPTETELKNKLAIRLLYAIPEPFPQRDWAFPEKDNVALPPEMQKVVDEAVKAEELPSFTSKTSPVNICKALIRHLMPAGPVSFKKIDIGSEKNVDVFRCLVTHDIWSSFNKISKEITTHNIRFGFPDGKVRLVDTTENVVGIPGVIGSHSLSTGGKMDAIIDAAYKPYASFFLFCLSVERGRGTLLPEGVTIDMLPPLIAEIYYSALDFMSTVRLGTIKSGAGSTCADYTQVLLPDSRRPRGYLSVTPVPCSGMYNALQDALANIPDPKPKRYRILAHCGKMQNITNSVPKPEALFVDALEKITGTIPRSLFAFIRSLPDDEQWVSKWYHLLKQEDDSLSKQLSDIITYSGRANKQPRINTRLGQQMERALVTFIHPFKEHFLLTVATAAEQFDKEAAKNGKTPEQFLIELRTRMAKNLKAWLAGQILSLGKENISQSTEALFISVIEKDISEGGQ